MEADLLRRMGASQVPEVIEYEPEERVSGSGLNHMALDQVIQSCWVLKGLTCAPVAV